MNEPFKDAGQEINYYKLICIFLFACFIGVGYKYSNLRIEYKKAESDKVWYCKEYKALMKGKIK